MKMVVSYLFADDLLKWLYCQQNPGNNWNKVYIVGNKAKGQISKHN